MIRKDEIEKDLIVYSTKYKWALYFTLLKAIIGTLHAIYNQRKI